VKGAAAQWFEVDRKGLAEVVQRRGGFAWLVQELISNAWDEPGVTTVDVMLVPEEGRPEVTIVVEDDAPDGFADLRHAWTLFAPSKKRGNAELRGRFNLGEKLVLALCKEAMITTTTGAVLFDERGRHQMRKGIRDRGSRFEGTVRMTREDLAKAKADLRKLIPPTNIATTIDGERLHDREPLRTFRACLWTEVAEGEEHALVRRVRHTDVRLFKPLPGETPMIYELGIPVVPTGDSLHVDVRQKVPLNLERDNVTPAYLRDLRSEVLNAAADLLATDDKASAWVSDAIGSANTGPKAIADVMTARFGEKYVSADPNDHEANQRAVSNGYKVVHGGALSADAWERVRGANLIQSAGKLFATPKPFVDGAPALNVIDEDTCKDYVRCGLAMYRYLGRVAFGRDVEIIVADDKGWPHIACWTVGRFQLVINIAKLDQEHWYDEAAIVGLAMHEYAHEKGGHLDDSYHEELCRLGGAFVKEASAGNLNLYRFRPARHTTAVNSTPDINEAF
jgi:hypothetical protein